MIIKKLYKCLFFYFSDSSTLYTLFPMPITLPRLNDRKEFFMMLTENSGKAKNNLFNFIKININRWRTRKNWFYTILTVP